jgi:hypothetical protein
MPGVEFEPMTSVFERAKTVHALDRTATVVGPVFTHRKQIQTGIFFQNVAYEKYGVTWFVEWTDFSKRLVSSGFCKLVLPLPPQQV